jgi:hypothetical protein
MQPGQVGERWRPAKNRGKHAIPGPYLRRWAPYTPDQGPEQGQLPIESFIGPGNYELPHENRSIAEASHRTRWPKNPALTLRQLFQLLGSNIDRLGEIVFELLDLRLCDVTGFAQQLIVGFQ